MDIQTTLKTDGTKVVLIDGVEYIEKPRWIALKDEMPEEGRGKLLVTNNIEARNALDEKSHIWLVDMVHECDGVMLERYGRFMAYDQSDRVIHDLTHFAYNPLDAK